jgi:hypothetical protein
MIFLAVSTHTAAHIHLLGFAPVIDLTGEGNAYNRNNPDNLEEGWDNIVEDLRDDEGFEDHDDSDVFVLGT